MGPGELDEVTSSFVATGDVEGEREVKGVLIVKCLVGRPCACFLEDYFFF